MSWSAGQVAPATHSSAAPADRAPLDMSCDLAIMGVGLVTPAGADAKETAFVVAAGAFDVLGSPYLHVQPPFGAPSADADEDMDDQEERRVDVRCCPWLGHRLELLPRIALMAQQAAGEALLLRSFGNKQRFHGRLGLYVIAAPLRAGFGASAQSELKLALEAQLQPAESTVREGNGALIDVLKEAQARLTSQRIDAALVVAVDSQVSLQAAAAQVQNPQSPWTPLQPALGEGAGALLFVHPHRVREFGDSLGYITGAGAVDGRARFDNEELIDGLPLTGLLARVRAKGPHVAAYGPQAFCALGSREWGLARCRNRGLLVEDSPVVSLEQKFGVLGAAASTVSLAYAVAAHFWGAVEYPGVAVDSMAPILVWGLGHDSRRCVVTAGLQTICHAQAAVEFTSSRGAPKLHIFAESRETGLTPDVPAPSAPELAGWVTFDHERGFPVPKPDHSADAILGLLDEAMLVAKHRETRYLNEAAQEDRQFFRIQDAIASFGIISASHLQAWWRANLESDDPYRSFVLAYTWASWAHPDSLQALVNELTLLPETARRDAHLAGRALALAPQPQLVHHLAAWAGHGHAVVSGAALTALAHLGQLQPEYIFTALGSQIKPLVADVLLWQAANLPLVVAAPHLPGIERWIHSTDPRLSWHAARAATILGSDNALWTLRQEAHNGEMTLANRLGSNAAELLVLAGDQNDAGLLAHWVQYQEMTETWLKNIALFGHVQSFSFLARYLTDEVLGDAAATALEILLGPVVGPVDRDIPRAWKSAVVRMQLDPNKRYRFGKAWAPERFVEELQWGELNWSDSENRLAELQRRLGRPLVTSSEWWAKDWVPHVQQLIQNIPHLTESRQGTWITLK